AATPPPIGRATSRTFATNVRGLETQVQDRAAKSEVHAAAPSARRRGNSSSGRRNRRANCYTETLALGGMAPATHRPRVRIWWSAKGGRMLGRSLVRRGVSAVLAATRTLRAPCGVLALLVVVAPVSVAARGKPTSCPLATRVHPFEATTLSR